ncbi:58 kDa phosphoprotein-like [Cloeon dipterum]|uniref:58 kDa phosphoprotein-like n=1 Tax=Cloeon dipterum TaxID=197152 RepID=UPI00321FEB53
MNKLVAVVALCFLANIAFAAKFNRDEAAEGGSSSGGSIPNMGAFMNQIQGIMEQAQAGNGGGGAENEEGSSGGSGGMFGMLGSIPAMPSGMPEMPTGMPEMPTGMPAGVPGIGGSK